VHLISAIYNEYERKEDGEVITRVNKIVNLETIVAIEKYRYTEIKFQPTNGEPVFWRFNTEDQRDQVWEVQIRGAVVRPTSNNCWSN
jgi:hypothetical protein